MQMRKIEFGRVLYSQHDRRLPHAFERSTNMRTEHAVGIYLRIIKKPVRSFKVRAFKRLGKRTLWSARQSTRKCDQALS